MNDNGKEKEFRSDDAGNKENLFENEIEKIAYPEAEDFEPEPPKPAGPLSHAPSAAYLPSVLNFIILFIIATVIYNGYPSGEMLTASGNKVYGEHQYWRIISSIFTHADIVHLLSNTWLFFIFGWFLRSYYGFLVFPVASLLTGVAATMITLVYYDPKINLVGASGMVYGMIGLWLVFYIRFDIIHTVPIRLFRAIGFILIMLFPTTFDPVTSYFAHFTGFLTGLVTAFLLLPFIRIIPSKNARGDVQ